MAKYRELLRKVYERTTDDPVAWGKILSIPVLIGGFAKLTYDLTSNQLEGEEYKRFALIKSIELAAYMSSIPVMMLLLSAGQILRKDKKSVRKTIESCIQEVKNQPLPEFPEKEIINISITYKDLLYTFFHQNQRSLKIAAKKAVYAKRNKSPILMFDAAMAYLLRHKIDEALMCLRDVLDLLEGKMPALSMVLKFFAGTNVKMVKINQKIFPEKIGKYIELAAGYMIFDPKEAYYWSQLAKKVATRLELPDRNAVYLFDALLATAQERSDVEESWKEAISLVRAEPVWERMGESRITVRRCTASKFFAQTLVFKERKEREALVKEMQATQTLAECVDEIAVPQSLYITKEPENGIYVYVMRYVAGETLYERIQKGDNSAIADVVAALAKIHANYPTNGMKKLDLEARLKEKLADKNFGVPDDAARVILRNAKPVIDSARTNVLWVWNKDAHPENWIIGDKIGVIDCEGDVRVPAMFDIVNLLDYTEGISSEEKRKYIEKYVKEMQKKGKDASHSRHAYHNSVVYRMISLAAAWSAPERERMRKERKRAMHRAIEAIDDMETDTDYYGKHAAEYIDIRAVLMHLKTTL